MRVDSASSAPADWDAYVDAHPDASAYHRSAAVEIGRAAFGLKPFYLTCRGDDGVLTGVLPLVEQSSLLFGRFLVSLPFFNYGGVLANDRSAVAKLVTRAGEIADERRARHAELRHKSPLAEAELPVRTDKVSMVLDLPGSEAELSKWLGSKLRSQVRRADRERPHVEWGGRELIPEFYGVFAATMHRLGTPVYPRRFFEVVFERLGRVVDLLVVRKAGVAQAAAVTVRHGNSIEVPWAAATADAKRVALNMRMYYELLRRSIELGAATFDFGRSTVDSGTYHFKAQWGARPLQLYWHYWLRGGAALPQLNHANPKFALAAAAWRRMPLWCANVLGPQIARHLP